MAAARAIAPLAGATIAFLIGYRGTFAATAMLLFMIAVIAFQRLPEAVPERGQVHV